ncbi:hypothetical protein LSH36_377g00002 [Paralvinella palmiformis]|uniref:V-type proton ATPase subunit a n=1 Tax=Paralvinella palmiformis TaxID=53620 RepID=A0AAD9JDU0_9ANNE|nr:hypothetical protein LSH36_377g00002 [Paralvinella palmiformis]
MGSLYRSEEMSLCQLYFQAESAYSCVSELGELGLVQFFDLNPDVNAFQRKFVNEVRRCEEMERKLRFLETELKKDDIQMLDTGDNPDAPAPREMVDLEATFEKLENEMKEVNTNAEALKRNFLELTELKHILRKTQNFLEEADHEHYDYQALTDPSLTDDRATLLDEEEGQSAIGSQPLRLGRLFLPLPIHDILWTAAGQLNLGLTGDVSLEGRDQQAHLGFVTGVILRERIPAFERLLWRACHGNVFLKQAEIESPLEDPSTGDQVNKSVFLIFFQGDKLKSKVKKICEGFRATLYPCPETSEERREMAVGLMTRIEDLNTVLNQTQDHRHRVLVAAAKNIKVWFIKVRKIKAIYHTLNMFNLDVTQKCLIGEGWCPVSDLESIQGALKRGTERSGSTIPSILNRLSTKKVPPTYNRTNRFTAVFQGVVDAYGVATYREVNPAPYTIITFPFLFSVMFGDLGHGVLMFLFALWMVIKEKALGSKKSDNEIWNMFFGGRYIILLMGAFSIYSGFLYNDLYAKSFNLFGSGFYPDPTINDGMYSLNKTYMRDIKDVTLDPNLTYSSNPYPYGMDPIWQFSLNKITFLNSFKMKISVTFGVAQMFFGVLLSISNHRYFHQPVNIFCEFIPQLLFLLVIFVYLVALIFVKWVIYDSTISGCAPSLLIGFINMFLFSYSSDTCSTATWFPGQMYLQMGLVVVAGICVPWMLIIKPFVLKAAHKKKATLIPSSPVSADNVQVITQESTGQQSIDFQHDEETEEFSFAEVFIHQAIHTIEYCLGCVSHTASYLRLWALSLAHAELSEVLWNMVLHIGLSTEGILGAIILFLVFAAWAGLTIAVLLLMEGLSAFLHTLRLHWVEFQSKFYTGDGYPFEPFSFYKISDGSSED